MLRVGPDVNITRIAKAIQRLGYGPDEQGSISSRCNDGIFSQHCIQTTYGAPPILLSYGYQRFTPGGTMART